MPRKPIQRSNEHYYHLTARSNNKENFHLPIDDVWSILIRQLALLQNEYNLKIGAIVLMNNHFHLLLLTPGEDIDRIMYFLMKRVTLRIQQASGRINKIFGGRYKGCLIDNQAYLLNVYKYIYRNPVTAGICEKAEDYPYSTLFFRKRGSSCRLKVEELLPEYIRGEYAWINQHFESPEVRSIKGGLRKSVFEYSKDRASGKAIEPLSDDKFFIPPTPAASSVL